MNEPAGIAMPSYQRLSWLWVCLVLSCLPAASAWAGAVGAGYAVVVSDAATPLERRAGGLLEEGLGIGDSGLGDESWKAGKLESWKFGGREGRPTVYVGVSLASMTLAGGAGGRVDWAGLGEDGVVILKAEKLESWKAGNADMVIAGGGLPGGVARRPCGRGVPVREPVPVKKISGCPSSCRHSACVARGRRIGRVPPRRRARRWGSGLSMKGRPLGKGEWDG